MGNNESLITELAFRLILDSEESEGYEFNKHTIDASGAERLENLNKDLILEFLQDPNTKVSVVDKKTGLGHCLLASNSVSNESIRINGIADHYLTLLNVVDKANKVKKLRKKDPNTPLLTHDLIKDIDLSLQPFREGEAGIGDYRQYINHPYKMGFKMPMNVIISQIKQGSTDPFPREVPINSIQLAKCDQVKGKMDELIDWVNNQAFKSEENIMRDIAEFHARFIKIHPFRDGNGRTGRLLMNYLLLILGRSPVTVSLEDKQEYNMALDYANSDDIKMSIDEISNFEEFIKTKYPKRLDKEFANYLKLKDHKNRPRGKKYKITNSRIGTRDDFKNIIESEHQYKDKYYYLKEFLEEHQVNVNSKDAIKQILNNYGKRNVDNFISIGQIRANQVSYEPVD